jgi:hypothetical protein
VYYVLKYNVPYHELGVYFTPKVYHFKINSKLVS